MKEILISRGFRFAGSCACNCTKEEMYEHDNHPGLRMHICPTMFWVKKLAKPRPIWDIIDFGAVGRFDEAMLKYFTK